MNSPGCFRTASLTVVAAVGLLGFCFDSAQAEPSNEHGRAISNKTDVDQDFGFQGEYLGNIREDGKVSPFGLQVAARGDGQFSAFGFSGGLPGNGWDRRNALKWTGHRVADVIVLEGANGRLSVDRMGATFTSVDGVELGRLSKVIRRSGSMGAEPPPGATVLFNGTDVAAFDNAKITPEGWLLAGATTKAPFGDFHLHLEFRTPYMPTATGQSRGNSGVYIQQRYEVQILDSFCLPTVLNGCGALYRQKTPDMNMSFPPLSWQTYDIDFRAARWDPCSNKVLDARITLLHNGVRIQDNYFLSTKTGAGKPEGPEDRPLRLQFHGNPVHFRNVWLVAHQQPGIGFTPASDFESRRSLRPRNTTRGFRVWSGRRGRIRGI